MTLHSGDGGGTGRVRALARGATQTPTPRTISASTVALSMAAALASTACFGTPTPLVPSLGGSVGLPHNGVLTDAVELPRRGRGFLRFRPYSSKYWGNPRLVRALEDIARHISETRPGGGPLVVGDLSARHGGKISGHNSHRSGRDVDLLWYVTTPRGAPIPNPGFVHVGTDGLAPVPEDGSYVRLDVERQWELVKLLLSSESVDVQWMFCSRSVESLLIDYARARGEPDELVWHAETVLLQPGDSLNHDDHIHLRVACTPGEAVRGCEGGGPYWEWLPPLPRLHALDAELLDAIAEDPLPAAEEPGASATETTASARTGADAAAPS